LIYRPALLGLARVHFSKSSDDIDVWETVALMPVVESDVPDDIWAEAEPIQYDDLEFETQPDAAASFGELPSALSQPKQYAPGRRPSRITCIAVIR